MRKKTTFLTKALLFTGIISLFSCVDNAYDFGNLDKDIAVDTQLGAPLAYSTVKITDLLNDSLNGMELAIEDEKIYILKKDSQNIGNDIVGHLKVSPKGQSNDNITVGIPGSPNITSAELNQTNTFIFNDINTNPNERLDSVLFENSYISLRIESRINFSGNSYIDIKFKTDEFYLDQNIYPNNTIRVNLNSNATETQINVRGAVLKLDGNNSIELNYSGHIESLTEFSPSEQISIIMNYDNIIPHVTYMNIGTARDMYDNTTSVEFDINAGLSTDGCFLPFYDPIIRTICDNNIGIPARYYIDWVEGIDEETGERVRADFGGTNPDTCSFIINYPTFDEISTLSNEELLNYDISQLIKETEVIFDRDFGNTNKLFSINVSKLEYKYRIRSIDNNPNNVHFFFQESDMRLEEDIKLGLWFEGNQEEPSKNFYMQRKDTLAINLGNIETGNIELIDNSKGLLKLNCTNHLPIGTTANLKFLNELKQPILTELERTIIIDPATVDANGIVVEITNPTTVANINMNEQELNTFLTEVRYIYLDYKLNNSNNVTIQATTNDWLNVRIFAFVDGVVIINQQ